MAWGGFAPMPIRLGGNQQDGWPPEAQSRLCNDLAAAFNTIRFSTVTYTTVGGTLTIESYNGRNGVGLSFAPSGVRGAAGDVTFTWPASWEDQTGTRRVVAITKARASAGGSTPISARIVSASGRTVRVIATNLATSTDVDCRVTLVTWQSERRTKDDYGGSIDKRASATEGTLPYAWGWYQHYRYSRGSAYSTEMSGLVHVENLALARSDAAVSRAAEKLQRNSQPGTSDEKLGTWASIQRVVQRPGETRESVRRRCAAKYKAAEGNHLAQIEAACDELLGAAFVRVWTSFGTDLATPPTQTYWPTINPGPSSHDLGGGAWFSERAHLTVEVQRPSGMTTRDYRELLDVHLYNLLNDTLPSWATFDWSEGLTGSADGFHLDIDDMDFVGFG